MRFENTPFYYDLIGHQFEIITGGTPSTKNKNYWKGDIPWMPSGDINKKYIFDVSKSISELGLTNSSAKMVPYHSVLIALAGQGKTRGTSAILEMNCCINQSLAAILPNNKFNPYYIFHYLESKYDDLRLISSGDGGRGGLNKELISNYKISYPTLPEQNKIADFFNKIDERIQAQIKIIDKYKSLINQIYDCFLWNPKGSKKIKLADILVEKNEKSKINNQYPILSSTVKGLFLQSEYFDKEIASSNNTGYKITHRGDIIISPQNLWMGNITYNGKFDNGLVSPSYKIYAINDKYNPTYISTILKSYRALYMFKSVSEQGASVVRRNLNIDAFYEISLNIPEREVQDKLSKLIDCFNIKISLEEKYVQDLQLQKKFLLENMFI